MQKPIEVNIFGIKCDSCSYEDITVQVEDYPEWINRPCPDCGKNLLTEADYQSAMAFIKFAEMANSILPQSESSTKRVTLSAKMNGSGDIDFELVD